MEHEIVVAGAGIGGLAAALGLTRAGALVRVLERSPELAEYGAGIQLGPNVTRRLLAWDLKAELDRVVAYPPYVCIKDAHSAAELGRLGLGQRSLDHYGAPYVAIHRADLQQLLYQAALQSGHVAIEFGLGVESFVAQPNSVRVQCSDGRQAQAQVLVGADGIWSRVRQTLLGDGEPRMAGHLAYRAALPQSQLPAPMRTQCVTVWWGPGLHVVHYPVRAGEWLNVVAIVAGQAGAHGVRHWDHPGVVSDLLKALRQAQAHASLIDLVLAVPNWRLWALCDRAPMTSAPQQAQGRVALLGDAAHPMRPYMAQGAGMAIEDAAELQLQWATTPHAPELALRRYAQARWQRNARVQRRAIRNGQTYHAKGWTRWGRDCAIKLLGERIMDVPWLYRY